MLNEQQFEAKWKEIKGGIRNLWGQLTEDELDQMKGNLHEIVDVVQDRYGDTREEIQQKFNQLMDSFDNDTDKNISPDEASYMRKPTDSESYRASFDSDRNARH